MAGIIEAGCDEAGRGCLAGPVFAAAVILPTDYCNNKVNDSKQLNAKQRESLRHDIERSALAWAIGIADAQEIDQVNILNASYIAMHRAIAKLNVIPEHLIIDGNRFKNYPDIPHSCIVRGDSKYFSIAAASILAKTYRDDFMKTLALEFPAYGWDQNKGYPTPAHRESLKKYGLTKWHRRSFKLLNNQLEISFTNNFSNS